MLLVPGDCPALHPGEVDTLVGTGHDAPAVTVVPDRHGTGTNGLLLTPPDVIAPSFGPGSRERHVQAARHAGADCEIAEFASLVLDVDTAADLEALRDSLAARTGGAAHPGPPRAPLALVSAVVAVALKGIPEIAPGLGVSSPG